METPGGILRRLGEKILSWIAMLALILLGIAVYQMPAETKAAIWSGVWRTLVWVGIAAVVPWSARLFIRRVLEAGTNWSGAALVAGLTLVDVIAGWALLTGWPASGWGWIALFSALGLAGTYNYLVAEYLAETAGE